MNLPVQLATCVSGKIIVLLLFSIKFSWDLDLHHHTFHTFLRINFHEFWNSFATPSSRYNMSYSTISSNLLRPVVAKKKKKNPIKTNKSSSLCEQEQIKPKHLAIQNFTINFKTLSVKQLAYRSTNKWNNHCKVPTMRCWREYYHFGIIMTIIILEVETVHGTR